MNVFIFSNVKNLSNKRSRSPAFSRYEICFMRLRAPFPFGEGRGEAVTRTSSTPLCFSILRGSLAATAFGRGSQGTSVARKSPSGAAVAGR